jgi:hypothetical protein
VELRCEVQLLAFISKNQHTLLVLNKSTSVAVNEQALASFGDYTAYTHRFSLLLTLSVSKPRVMASGLGIADGALGITSIAAQLARSVWTLRTFYRHVMNAPTELFDTVEALEHFSVMLQRLAQDCNQNFLRMSFVKVYVSATTQRNELSK